MEEKMKKENMYKEKEKEWKGRCVEEGMNE